MIQLSDVFKIGKLGKTHGLKGEIDLRYTDDIFTSDECEYLVCEIDGLLVPFYVEDWRLGSGDNAILKFEGYDSMEAVAIMQNANVYYPKSGVKGPREELGSWKMLTGFAVSDKKAGNLGIVAEVDDSSANVLLVVDSPDGQEMVLPIHPDLVEALDLNARTMQLDLPEGVLDLNIEH